MTSPVRLRPRRNLTPAQELIWTAQRLHPEVPLANMANLSTFAEPVDPERFVAAVDRVVAASDALRTTVREVEGVPHPRIEELPPRATEVASIERDDLESWMRERIARPLDVSECVYDSVLLVDETGEWSWWMNVHHIATDAASSALIFQSVAAAYHDDWAPGPTYGELADEVEADQSSDRTQAARAHWAELDAAPEPTPLYRPDTGSDTRAERVLVSMDDRSERLDRLLADRFRLLSPDLSLTAALLAALGVYLRRVGGGDRVTVGLPVHHRSTRLAKQVIGPLVELFPVVIEFDEDDTFATVQTRAAEAVFSMLRHARPGTSPRQAFDVVLNVHAATFGPFGPIAATTRWFHPGHIDAHHRLRIQALDYTGAGDLEIALDLNHRTADADHRRRAGEHFGAVLDAMLADPDSKIDDVEIVGADERLLLADLVETGPGVALDAPAPVLVANRLRAAPAGSAAIVEGERVLTASELDAEITAVAESLRHAGYGRGDRIGVEMGIGLDAVVVIHGILRSGAAFVPIDPEYPEGRRDHLRHDSGAELVIESREQALHPAGRGVARPSLGDDPVQPDDLAYIIYTSGSTGVPKGVPITHRGLAEYLGFAFGSYLTDVGRPTMPLFTSLSFDLTITTLFLPLLAGGTMTVHPAGGLVALRQIADAGMATIMKATPSHLELLVRMAGPDLPLRALIVGGEAFTTDLADRLLGALGPDVAVFNEYGPTEAVVGCMIHRYDPEADTGPEVPIGRPAPGVQLRILDAHGHLVPVGAFGELTIARPGLSSGYLNRSELTAERFRPTGDGTVAYHTGDRVRLADIDRMIYHGRFDEQIKVQGVRIEPGEIEAVAAEQPGVRRAVASLWRPAPDREVSHCVRCGLGSDVPGVAIDGDGVCTSCHEYDLVAPQAAAWFRDEEQLRAELAAAADRATGDYDVIHLLSGGKDSTYALYRLVELGVRVLALTLDNGYISEGAKANCRRAAEALGVDHEMVTVDGMAEIFRDSLERFSNVCNGCYKAIYTVALQRAEQLGVSAIVTGLSRGQFFETRLVPGLFGADRFDLDAIDGAVLDARKAYHRTPDAVAEHLDVDFLADGTVLDRVTFIDLYRYVDVELAEIYDTLESTGTWERPTDTGRSTNCLINAAGIYVHRLEQGHHNYAVPYSWDVRLGHKTRAEALDELDDPMDDAELASIASMLADVGYEPRPTEVLTLWVEGDEALDLEELRSALTANLPEHSRPRAIERVDEIPLTVNGKVDTAALPAPAFRRTIAVASGRLPDSTTEQRVASVWETVLGLDAVTADTDFFEVGGTSLHALEMVVRLSDAFGVVIPESYAFTRRTVAEMAAAIDELTHDPGSERGRDPIAELDPEAPLPMSAGEQAMLYAWRSDPDDFRYNIARLFWLPDDYDPDRLDAAARLVVAAHANLRTSYGAERQPLPLDRAFRTSTVAVESATLPALAEEVNRQRFDLVYGPLISLHHLSTAVADERGTRGVMIRAHHIVTDARSLDILWDQIATVYAGGDPPEPATSYAAHAEWQRRRRPDPASLWPVEAGDRLGELMVRPPRPEPDGYVTRPASVSLDEIRIAPGATPFASALTALAASIGPFMDHERFEVAVTASVRDHPDLADVVGYFVNPLPLVVEAYENEAVRELADRVDSTLAASLEHRAVPFASVVGAARADGRPVPAARLMLAVEQLAPAHLSGQPIADTVLASGTAVTDLTFFAYIRDQAVELGCEYRGTVVTCHQAEAMLERFDAALRRLVDIPTDQPLVRRPDALTLTGDPLGPAVLTPERIALSIETAADAEAVTSGDRSLTYAELDREARALAGRLRAVGVEAGDRVAVVVPRSVDLPVAIVAAWSIGASYVPIDVSQPSSRVAELVAAAGVRAAVTSGGGHPGLADVVTIAADRSDAAVLPVTKLHETQTTDEAYVIFTSGSTGRPKGVPVTHGNLAASLAARLQWYGEPVERYLLLSSAGFDSSIAGLFWALADGGELIVPSEAEVHDVDALLGLIERHRPTHTLCVPSLYGAMLTRYGRRLPGLETVIVAGEACPVELVERHEALAGDVSLVNEYGPTEATVWATGHRCAAIAGQTTVPIGGPIPGVSLRVIDPSGRAVGADTAGELVISGPTVVSGYIDGDDSPFAAGPAGRGYRTGDLVVVRGDGTLEFLGRVDEQLSVGGVRIEPAEVEQALMTIPGVSGAAVDARGGALVAFIEGPADIGGLRPVLAERLAPALVPSRYHAVAELPRTPNGKIDRAAVADLVIADPDRATTTVDPDDTVLMTVSAAFREAFDGRTVEPSDDFFSIGGDSLRAVVLVSALERDLDRRVGIGELVDAPTPVALARRLGSSKLSARPLPAGDPSGLIEWLRSDGRAAPLVVLPPGGGNLLRYAPLVGALPAEIPVVGVRLPGADARSAIAETIEDQATIMLAALDSAVATGPYRLLGWSTGGLLAWELARLLIERGDEVEIVALVDTFMAGVMAEPEVPVIEKYRSLLAEEGVARAVTEGWGRLRERTEFALARRRYRQARDRAELPAMADAERELGPVIRRAAADYRPVPISAPTVFFAASETEPRFTTEPWLELTGTLDVVSLDGVHYEPADRCIIGAHRVGELVEALVERLDPVGQPSDEP